MGYNPALTPRFDLEKAKALMKAAGLESEIGFVSLEGYLAGKFFCSVMRSIDGEPTRRSFVAAVERGNVLGCQFHPELSGSWGQSLLERWLSGGGGESC